MNSDFSDLLKTLNEADVKYLVVGGYAVGQHTEPRYTKDLDVWVEISPQNAERVYSALANFGAPLAGISPEDFTVPETIYQMGVEPVRVDILTTIQGVEFSDCWSQRTTAEFNGIVATFISIDDLIANKLKAARTQDLLDVRRMQQKKNLEPEVEKPVEKENK